MKFTNKTIWLLLLVPLLFLLWFFWNRSQAQPIRRLAYYGPKYSTTKNDSIHHRILPFKLINQYGDTTTLEQVKDKIVLSEFFFTTCQSICPIMNRNFGKIYKLYAARPDVLLLSHTVDPEQDSVPVMREYARTQGVSDKRWLFLTGDKTQLYHLARRSYLVNAEQGDGGPDDFIHTQNFALIDKNGCIRGYYDGTDSLEINRLILELNLLIAEHDVEKNNSDLLP